MTCDTATALQRLRDGNRRFVDGITASRYTAEDRARSTEGQQPFAIVLGCSDARVPVEVVFDAGIGELFIVRAAGHIVSDAGLASLRFAVQKLGVRTIVVLGHEDCGAVNAALDGYAPGWLAPIVDHIDVAGVDPSAAPEDADNPLLAAAVDAHVRETQAELRELFAAMDLPDGPPQIVGAAYKLASGVVHWLD